MSSELQPVLADTVPLGLVVDRIVSRIYSDLSGLTEILPSAAPNRRKEAIADYVLDSRRELVKLLVLLVWAQKAPETARAMSGIAFLERYHEAWEQATNSLAAIRQGLMSAKLRNFDLVSALDVLGSGSYNGLPTLFSDMFAKPERLSDAQVRDVFAKLDALIQEKLSLHETLPSYFHVESITDGRASVSVPEHFSADLTYIGDSVKSEGKWYLLDVAFWDKDAYQKVKGVEKNALLQMVNGVLASTSLVLPGLQVLDHLAARYKIEKATAAVRRLAASSWRENISFLVDRDGLTVNYWTKQKKGPSAQNGPPQAAVPPKGAAAQNDSAAPGTLRFTVTAATAASDAAQKAFESLTQRPSYSPRTIAVSWTSPQLGQGVCEEFIAKQDSADPEFLLTAVTEYHAQQLTSRLYKWVSDFSPSVSQDSTVLFHLPLEKGTSTPGSVFVNPRSGHIVLRLHDDIVPLSTLRSVADSVNANPRLIATALTKLRFSIIRDAVEARLRFAGMRVRRNVALSNANLGPTALTSILVDLSPHFVNNLLALCIAPDGFRLAILHGELLPSGARTFAVRDLFWLAPAAKQPASLPPDGPALEPLPQSQNAPPALDTHLECTYLRYLHPFTLRTLAILHVQRQMLARKIVFQRASDGAYLYLVAKSKSFNPADVALDNVAIQALLAGDRLLVSFTLRLHDAVANKVKDVAFPAGAKLAQGAFRFTDSYAVALDHFLTIYKTLVTYVQ